MKNIKCVVVGDNEAGKTCLLNSYTTDKLPIGDFPMLVPAAAAASCDCESFATCVKTVKINDEEYSLQLCDTSGQENYENIRLNTYTDTDVFLVCFSVVSPSTFENVTDKWVPEILRVSPKTPFLLVGTQVDLRDNENTLEQALTFTSGEELALELKAVKYMECSARTQEGVREVFEEAILATRNPTDKKSTYFCVLL
ncbi:cell division control protein 42 homolog isoform X2 [Simochromis diagramma]|uniref:cell division control protein 42 homolog isoform X2 n=1 Tax=Simochromis diagramma TaxID=43689 RepID=UPI001A7E69F5|nr:cell division control protein 42 homolog isoform X2 [Simochromis diagramma]XP_039878968.1 cell division control protein 42 homolog isoform X2 [Simochromis diagramma]